jgi:hypothetical protein
MWRCYQMPEWAAEKGQQAAAWLRQHQTWTHSAAALMQVMQEAGVLEAERVYA